MVESSATKVVLHQDQAAIDVLGPAFNLSEAEKRFVVNSRVGEGVLLTQDGYTQFYNYMNDIERQIYTTRSRPL